MKKLLIFFAVLMPFPMAAQQDSDQMLVGERRWSVAQLPLENGAIVYKGDIELDGFSRETLYNKAYHWLKQNLKGSDTDMRVHSKKYGQIAGRGRIVYTQRVIKPDVPQIISFDYELRIGEGNYTYRLDNFQGLTNGSPLNYSTMYQEELTELEATGVWTHRFRYELLSDLHSFVTLFLQGLKAEMARSYTSN